MSVWPSNLIKFINYLYIFYQLIFFIIDIMFYYIFIYSKEMLFNNLTLLLNNLIIQSGLYFCNILIFNNKKKLKVSQKKLSLLS